MLPQTTLLVHGDGGVPASPSELHNIDTGLGIPGLSSRPVFWRGQGITHLRQTWSRAYSEAAAHPLAGIISACSGHTLFGDSIRLKPVHALICLPKDNKRQKLRCSHTGSNVQKQKPRLIRPQSCALIAFADLSSVQAANPRGKIGDRIPCTQREAGLGREAQLVRSLNSLLRLYLGTWPLRAVSIKQDIFTQV